MKRISKKLVALLLAAVMLVSMLPVSALADTAQVDDFNQLLTVMADGEKISEVNCDPNEIVKIAACLLHNISEQIKVKDTSSTHFKDGSFNADDIQRLASTGDSTVYGFGHEDYTDKTDPRFTGYHYAAKESYPAFLKRRFSIADTDFSQLAIGGSRTVNIRYLLEDCFKMDGLDSLILYPAEEIREEYREIVSAADLVTVGIGSNDLFSATILRTISILSGAEPFELNWEQFPCLNNPILNKAIDAMIAFMDKAMPNLELSLADAKALAETLVYGMACVYYNIPQIVEDLHCRNEDAKVLLVGLNNPVENLRYQIDEDPDANIQIGEFLSAVLSWVNASLRSYALKHNEYCCYIDASYVSVYGDYDQDFQNFINLANFSPEYFDIIENIFENSDLLKMIHSDPQSHHQVYSEILESLKMEHHAHRLEYVPEQPATCVKEGVKAHYVCVGGCEYEGCEHYADGCGKLFTDESGKNEVTEQDLVIPVDPNAHQFGQWTKVDEETHMRECELCAKVETEKHIVENEKCSDCGSENLTANTHTGINQTQYVLFFGICCLLACVLLAVAFVKRRKQR